MKHFLIDKNYGTYLATMGFSVEEILKKAMLPEDLFARQTPSLTAEEYFRFMQAVDTLSPDEQTPVKLAASENIEAFLPPIFAAYCSKNALTCFKRLAQYKPLIGALLYRVEETESEVSVEVLTESPELNKRLSMMQTDDSYAARVRSALMELLPGGECLIEDVAKKLGYSKRSLQRKLQEENMNFQKQLNHTRELLAKYYVSSTDMRAEDIAIF